MADATRFSSRYYTPGDPALLDELPHLAGSSPRPPIRLQQQLYDAFGLQLLYSKKHHRVTIRATVTRTTPATIAAITATPFPTYRTPHIAAVRSRS